ncbi:MAG: ABC transporter ATP-binding protein [Planctomycetes bacterium]|nr:ABC transporter ATP-binding protein [Planctomycetota bacterium]
MSVLLRTEALQVHFGEHHAVNGIDFMLHAAESVLLVGESGSGKSTLLRALLALQRPSSGRVLWHMASNTAQDPWQLPPQELRRQRQHIGMVFQDSLAAFDPRLTLRASLEEPLLALGAKDLRERVNQAATEVGLDAALLTRMPREVSGGQRQRAAIARSLITQPRALLLDEAVASLDVSLRAQILALLLALRAQRGLAMAFVTHDLAVARALADRIVVLLRGRVVEDSPADNFFRGPLHPYAQELLRSALPPEPALARAAVARVLPHEEASTNGCAFAPQCPLVEDRCRHEVPTLVTRGAIQSACFAV